MAEETTTETTTTPEEKKPVISSAGAPQRAALGTNPTNQPAPVEDKTEDAVDDVDTGENNNNTDPNAPAATNTNTETDAPEATEKKLSELSDTELQEYYKKKFPTQEAKSAIEIETEARAFEKRQLDLYIEQGGKIEDYAKIKEINALDSVELGKNAVINQLTKDGYSADFIEDTLKERYGYGLKVEDLEQDEVSGETDDEFQKRKDKLANVIKLGNTALTKRGEAVKTKAANISDTLKQAIETTDSEAKKESDFTAKVEKLSTTLPRKITSELGKLNDKDLGSVSIDVPETEITAVIATLKDPAQRKQLLYNEDNSINETRIADLLLKERMFNQAARDGYFSGSSAQVKIFETMFPHRSPNSLGTGGSPVKDPNAKGKVASFGTPQRQQQTANR